MLDATVIETTAARAGGDEPGSDPDARFTCRAGRPGSSYGYKAHVGIEEGAGIIRAVVTTPANANNTVPADAGGAGRRRLPHARSRSRVIRYRGLTKAAGYVIIADIAFNMRRWVTLAAT